MDASVAVKWYLSDEADTVHALALLADFRDGFVRLIAPEQIRYEVPSAIRNALRTGRLTHEQGRQAIASFLSWPVTMVRDKELVIAAYDLALRFGGSLYDGLYLALAEMTGSRLVHADARLHRGLGDHFPLALWLPDYHPVSR
ncbi:MAG TPA: type II toxin-antitoxin system VapC family toxin [Thermomicrobiales bacterium]|nr:type II toxin-antitoxin system VapC family toxin [Thermomicrobiales bacterium]